MGDTIPELSETSSITDSALFLLSFSGAPSQIASFYNLCRNLTTIRSYSTNDLTLGVGSSSSPVVRVTNSNKYVGIGYSDSFSPISLLHISGTTGSNTSFTLENAANTTGIIRFYDANGSWYLRKSPNNEFSISGVKAGQIYKNSFHIDTNGNLLLTDGSQYANSTVDSDVNLQVFAETGIRLSVDNNTVSNDFTFSASGIDSTKDLYVGYYLPNSAVSGSFFGLSGALFVDKDDATVRIGNSNRPTDARLMVSNVPVGGYPYKTLLVEDANVANIFLKASGSSNTASIHYNQPVSQLHFARNKTSASAATTDKVIFDLANGRIGIGGIDPSYPIDITGSSALISRFQSSANYAFSRIQSNISASTGPVDYVATAFGSGDYNSFIIGYDFDKSVVGPSGPSTGPTNRVGQFFFQTGDATNTYSSSRNVLTISDQGDVNAKGIYTSDDEFCYGKFLDIHRASNLTGGAVYLNFDNIDYGYVRTGSAAYHSFMPASGRVIGVDFICQLNSGLTNATGFLVFNRFTGMQLTNVGGSTYVSGSSSPSNRKFLQVWNPNTNNFAVPDLSFNSYVSGRISGQGILNLKARIGNSTDGSRFTNNTAFLNFDRNNFGGWVAYAVNSGGILTPLTGAMNLTTMVEYFIASDADSSSSAYLV